MTDNIDDMHLTKRLCDFYGGRVKTEGVTYSSVWGDNAEWKSNERFKIIESSDFEGNELITDLGCGTGLLYKYLTNIMTSVNYMGIDVVPEFLAYVANTYKVATKNLNFFNNLPLIPHSDWYAIFGSINKKWMVSLSDSQPVDLVYAWVNELFDKASKGIYLNCFSARTDCPKANNVHLDPIMILEMLGNKVKYYRVRHDLDFYEFSLMVRK